MKRSIKSELAWLFMALLISGLFAYYNHHECTYAIRQGNNTYYTDSYTCDNNGAISFEEDGKTVYITGSYTLEKRR